MTEYAAGTVAVATVRGVPNVRVISTGRGPWISPESVGGTVWHDEEHITDVRPLVVLGLDDAAHCLTALRLGESQEQSVTSRLLLHSVIGKIEAQTKPPRIPEPGLYGVVEAETSETGLRRFCHLEDDAEGWSGAGSWRRWSELIDPVLVRPGIEDES